MLINFFSLFINLKKRMKIFKEDNRIYKMDCKFFFFLNITDSVPDSTKSEILEEKLKKKLRELYFEMLPTLKW